MPKLNEIYGGNYLKAEDLKDRGDVIVTIESISIMEGDDGKKKVVLHFKGKDKTLPLNITNANMVTEVLNSDDTDDWEGQRICLYTCKVDFQGKRVLAIRIKEAKAKVAKKTAPPPPPAEEDEMGGNLDDDSTPASTLTADDIPF